MVVGVYARMYFARRNRGRLAESRERRERGAATLVYTLSIPAFGSYAIALSLHVAHSSLLNDIFGPEGIGAYGCLGFAIAVWLTVLFTWGLAAMTAVVARNLYGALV